MTFDEIQELVSLEILRKAKAEADKAEVEARVAELVLSHYLETVGVSKLGTRN